MKLLFALVYYIASWSAINSMDNTACCISLDTIEYQCLFFTSQMIESYVALITLLSRTIFYIPKLFLFNASYIFISMIKEHCEKLIELEKEDHATVTVVLSQRLSDLRVEYRNFPTPWRKYS